MFNKLPPLSGPVDASGEPRKPEHVCGLQGFGRIGDICRGCDFDAVQRAAAVPSPPAQEASTRTLAALDELAAKPELRFKGWDTYGSEPLDDRAIAAVRTFLGYPWAVVPCSDGGVQLEMHHSGIDVEIEFNADGSIETAYAETVADQLAALPSSSPVADSPTKDYQAACEVLPDSLGRPLAARIQLVLDNMRRESHIACELRRELDGGIERDARAIEQQWPDAARYLRSHAHIEDGV